MELKEGMYVRTTKGIAKIIGKNDNVRYCYPNAYISDTYLGINDDTEYLYEEDIIKASYNVIDLIEVGDYVNGRKVLSIHCDDGFDLYLVLDGGGSCDGMPLNPDIKSIVTKEQFESMSYKVGE